MKDRFPKSQPNLNLLYCAMTDNDTEFIFNAIIQEFQNVDFYVAQVCRLVDYDLDDDLLRSAIFTIIDAFIGQGGILVRTRACIRVYDFPVSSGRCMAVVDTANFRAAIFVRTVPCQDEIPSVFGSLRLWPALD